MTLVFDEAGKHGVTPFVVAYIVKSLALKKKSQSVVRLFMKRVRRTLDPSLREQTAVFKEYLTSLFNKPRLDGAYCIDCFMRRICLTPIA
jgi:hypothetical protein